MEEPRLAIINDRHFLELNKHYLILSNILNENQTQTVLVSIGNANTNKYQIINAFMVSVKDFLSYLKDTYEKLYLEAKSWLNYYTPLNACFWEVPKNVYDYFQLINTLEGEEIIF